MKVMTILGTRPEIIRSARVINKLDQWADQHVVVHTGQNTDPRLSDLFFNEMRIRRPDFHLSGGNRTLGGQLGNMFEALEGVLTAQKPDRVLVLGDTNSALSALLVERMGIPVYHMEAGNRCFDVRVPEEINRRAIDAVSTYNLPYTPGSRENLLREGMPAWRVWVSGNPIHEVMQFYQNDIRASDALSKLGLEPKGYLLVTAHRAENVDSETRLRNIVSGLQLVADQWNLPIVCSVHPRTHDKIQRFGVEAGHPLIRFCQPFGFFDFVALEQGARCVITDSGTVQEESCLLGVPAVTIRDTTERPETVVCGSNIVSGLNPQSIAASTELMLAADGTWPMPEGYVDPNVSTKVTQFILGGLRHV